MKRGGNCLGIFLGLVVVTFSSGAIASTLFYVDENGRESANELATDDSYTLTEKVADDATQFQNLSFETQLFDLSFLTVTTTEHVDVATAGYTASIGSDEEIFNAPIIPDLFSDVENIDLSYSGVKGFDFAAGTYTAATDSGKVLLSSLLDNAKYSTMIVAENPDEIVSGKGSGPVSVSGGAALLIDNSYIYSEGAERIPVQNSGTETSTMVVKDSLIIAKGYSYATSEFDKNLPNDPLLVTGATRANYSGGQSETFYYDTVVITDGWASLSTDGASGTGVDLVAVNTFASSVLGGYGVYADKLCRDYLYGTVLEGAEYGAIIASTGSIYVFDGNEGMRGGDGYDVGTDSDIDPYEFADSGKERVYGQLKGTVVAGGRNAVMIHNPSETIDDSTVSVFSAKDSELATNKSLISLDDNYYGSILSANIQKYVDYTSGDAILIKGTNADITLDNISTDLYDGVLVHSVLNNDLSGQTIYDDETDVGTDVVLKNSIVSGDILNEDYEREMRVDISNTVFTGKIFSGTVDTWNDYWLSHGFVEDYTYGTASNSFGEVVALDVFCHNIVVNDDGTYTTTSYDAVRGSKLTLESDATWNVTAVSTLTELTVMDGAQLNGIVTIDGNVVSLKDLVTAGTVSGEIVVSPLPYNTSCRGNGRQQMACQGKEAHPETAIAWYNNGNDLCKLGKKKEALQSFTTALNMFDDTNSPYVYSIKKKIDELNNGMR